MDKGEAINKVVKLPGTFGGFRENGPSSSAQILEVLGSGRYVVSISGGGKIEVEGAEGLRVGEPVRVLAPSSMPLSDALERPGALWSIVLPLGFGGKNALAEMKVYVEKVGEKVLTGAEPAVYMVLDCVTELQQRTQWSLYLRGRSVAIQVYPGDSGGAGEPLFSVITEVEENLKKKGFLLTGPTVILKRKFLVPRGFHLNIKG